MKKNKQQKKVNLDIKRSITKSVGRFISIMLLMALGSFALVGLFVTGPDMRDAASDYFKDYNTADLSVTSDYGIDKTEIELLRKNQDIKDMELIYMKDVVIKNTDKAFRLTSLTNAVSRYELKDGRLPNAKDEIAIDNYYNGEYKIGDVIEFSEKSGGGTTEVMNQHKFRIVGFVSSSEILSSVNRGMTTVGTGALEGYGVVTKDAFDSDVYMMAKITFKDTAVLDSFGEEYSNLLKGHKDKIREDLKAHSEERVALIKKPFQKQIDDGKKKLEDAKQKLDDSRTKLEDAKAQIESGKEDLAKGKVQIDQANVEIAEKEKALNEAKETLQIAISQGLLPPRIIKQKQAEIAQGEAMLEVAKEELKGKTAEYEAGISRIEESEKEYEKGLAEFTAKEPQALQDIQNAQRDIQKQQSKLNDLKKPTYSTFTRRELPGGEGNKTYAAVSTIVDKLANVFPIFLYFVAALVTLTTMTRYVSEERLNAGTLKALGYKNKDIIKKFVLYGLTAGITGTVIGVVLGHILMPYITYSAYSIGFTLYPIKISFYPLVTLAAVAASLVSAVIPTIVAAKNELRETPASLLMPKAPKPGTKILLEKIKWIWSKMSFTHKVTARNIFRYKSRMMMTIIGVAGATAVLFTGLAIQGSVSDIKDRQFLDILKYDMIVSQNEDLTKEEKSELDDLLNSDSIKAKESAYFEEASITAGAQNDTQAVRVVVPSDNKGFSNYIKLFEEKTGREISIDKGAVISKRLATLLDLKEGDTFTFQDSENNDRQVRISGICEMYAGHFLFMNQTDYHKCFEKSFSPNAQIVLLKDKSSDNTRIMANKFVSLSAVKTVSQNTTVYGQMNTIVEALDKIMVILIFIAAMLAIVIIYNLTNINVMERIRELSTIKVLGFRDKEVTMYIYRETICLSALAVIAGCLIGMGIHRYILDVLPSDEVMFSNNQLISTFLIPIVVIGVVTFMTGLYVNRKLKHIDMLEALKSVE